MEMQMLGSEMPQQHEFQQETMQHLEQSYHLRDPDIIHTMVTYDW